MPTDWELLHRCLEGKGPWSEDRIHSAPAASRSPEGDGYRERRRAGRGDAISPSTLGDVRIDVAEVFA
jgi:hypothetical protein